MNLLSRPGHEHLLMLLQTNKYSSPAVIACAREMLATRKVNPVGNTVASVIAGALNRPEAVPKAIRRQMAERVITLCASLNPDSKALNQLIVALPAWVPSDRYAEVFAPGGPLSVDPALFNEAPAGYKPVDIANDSRVLRGDGYAPLVHGIFRNDPQVGFALGLNIHNLQPKDAAFMLRHESFQEGAKTYTQSLSRAHLQEPAIAAFAAKHGLYQEADLGQLMSTLYRAGDKLSFLNAIQAVVSNPLLAKSSYFEDKVENISKHMQASMVVAGEQQRDARRAGEVFVRLAKQHCPTYTMPKPVVREAALAI